MLPRFLCTIKTRTLGPFLVLFYRLKQTVLPTRYQAVLPVATLARSSELTRRDADAKTERRARKMAQGAAATGGAGGKGGLPQTPLPPREHTCYISEFTNICLSLWPLQAPACCVQGTAAAPHSVLTRGTAVLFVLKTATLPDESLSAG